jgi:hypothetical protein
MGRSVGKVKLEPDSFPRKVMGFVGMDIKLLLPVRPVQHGKPFGDHMKERIA